ncbi:MAG TPA: adenylate/guanylate cyclase domain-containing protein, partial [Thermoanaerobaculia bacterium]
DRVVDALSELYGRPPYPRDAWARVIDELRRGGASVIAFDILFGEENPAFPESDRAFAEALKGSPAILGAMTTPQAGSNAVDATKLWQVRGANKDARNAIGPHPMFGAAAGIGSIRLAEQSGHSSTVHSYPLVDRVPGGWMPSLALESARLALHADRNATLTKRTFAFGGRRVPVDDDLEMLIRWNALEKPGALNYAWVPVDRLILASLQREEGTNAAELAQFGAQFKDKIVIVGYTAAGLFDLRATPLSAKGAGIEIHANALDNLLSADFNRLAPAAATLPAIVLLGAITGVAVGATRGQVGAAIIAIVLVAATLALGYLAMMRGWIVPTFAAAAAIALTYVVITVISFVAEQRQSAVLRTTFGRYVSPQILEHVLAHPEKVQLGGERRDLTILFSDIRGFTSISEASEPEEVVEMLNEYLTRMVEILLSHRGTLDKFIGDAVMGFWNAPAPDPDHARDAVLCAIEMVQETARLRARWEAEGKAALRIGVGINTGEAVVGNIGAERVFGYTVIGDAVNLASRLEGTNKEFGTEIIVSEFTHARMGEGFDTVSLGEVKVKGKENAVKIYQIKVPNSDA